MPRGLQIPGQGTPATCYKEVGWREVGCPSPGCKTVSPALHKVHSCRVRAQPKLHQRKRITIAINREMHIH